MPFAPSAPFRYTNPILDADVPDPDAIRLPDGRFALVASSFDRLPGLPLWCSDDLLDWVPVGFASVELEPRRWTGVEVGLSASNIDGAVGFVTFGPLTAVPA